MLHNYFKTYEVEDPDTHFVKILGTASYVLAAVLGSFYVLIMGFFARFVVALAIDAACVVATAGWAVVLNDYLDPADMIIPFFVFVIGLCMLRSIPMVILVKNGYRSRGWMITRI